MTTGGEGVDQAGAQSVYERFSTPDDIWSYVEGVFRQYPHNWVVAEQYPDLRDNMAYLDKLVWGSADEGVVVLETGLGGDYQRYHDLACYGQFEEGVPPALRRHARLSERFEYVGGPTKSSQDIAVQKLSRPPFFDRYTVTPYEIPVIIEAIGEPLGTEEATLLLASMESARQTNQQKRELVGMEAVASVTEQVEALRAQAQPTRERYTQKRAEIAAANVRITEAQAELRQLEEEAWMLGQHLKPHERTGRALRPA